MIVASPTAMVPGALDSSRERPGTVLKWQGAGWTERRLWHGFGRRRSGPCHKGSRISAKSLAAEETKHPVNKESSMKKFRTRKQEIRPLAQYSFLFCQP
jgi:hypothetical protein